MRPRHACCRIGHDRTCLQRQPSPPPGTALGVLYHAGWQVVKNTDLVVGDVYMVNMGDKVVADGIMIDGFHLVIDEASLTGDVAGATTGSSLVPMAAGQTADLPLNRECALVDD